MSKLTKYEKETIVLFNEGEDTAHIQTYNAGLRKRLETFSKKHPDLSNWIRPMGRAACPTLWTSLDCPSVCNRRTARNADE